MDRRIISPMFLDRPAPELAKLARPGDIVAAAGPGDGDQISKVAPIHRSLAEHTADAIGAGERPVAVIGDCCQAIAVLAGLQRAGLNPRLIWLDAHGDFNTRDTSPSGFLGGMPLAMITGRGDLRMNRQVGLKALDDAMVTLSDARDLDPGERELVAASGIRHAVTIDTLLQLPLPEGPLYVHFDTDIIDCTEAPAFYYPVRGGPSARAVKDLLTHLGRNGRVAAASMTAWAPELDKDGTTSRLCLDAFAALLA
jgi:arginase